MSKEKNKVLKAGIWYTICNFIVKGLSFISMPIFTRIMSKSDIGMFSNITSWVSILTIITSFEIHTSITIARFDYKEDIKKYISSCLFLSTVTTIFFYINFLCFHTFFEKLFMIDFFNINLIFIYLLIYPAIEIFQIKNRIEYKYSSVIFLTILNALLSTISSIFLVLTMKNKLQGRILGYFIPFIITGSIVYFIIMYAGKSIEKKYWKYALNLSLPIIVHSLAGYILNSSDKIMITKLVSKDANALYSVSYTISTVVSILWSSMNNAWSPWAYEQMNKKKYDNLRCKSKPYFLFFLGIVTIFMVIAPEIIYIMAGKDYTDAIHVIPPIMLGYVFQFVYSLYVNIEYYFKKQKLIALGTFIAAFINIGLNFIFIPLFGYIAAAYTTLIGYIILYLSHYFIVKKMGYSSWYDNKFFSCLLSLFLIFMFVINFLYNFFIVRILVIIILISIGLVFLFKNKNLILKIKNRN